MEPTSPVKNSSVSEEEDLLNGASSSIHKEKEETLDPRLDFLSEEFDPVKVLQVSPNEVHLPHPSIHPCDNLQSYLSVVQGTSRYAGRAAETVQTGQDTTDSMSDEGGAGRADHVANEVDIADAREGVADAAAKTESTGARKPIKTVIDFMQTRSRNGPFSILHQCWVDGKRVRVLTRHCAGVRGVCTGCLIAFDHHMNLVLRDVEEWWAPFKTIWNGGITLSKNQRRRRNKQKVVAGETLGSHDDEEEGVFKEGCWQNCGGKDRWERYQFVKQLYLRGDNIILVSNVT